MGVSLSSFFPSRSRLGFFAAAFFLFLSVVRIGFSATDDDRITALKEQVHTLENVIASSNNTNERSRLESKLQRLNQELSILQEQQALDERQRNLTVGQQSNTTDMLREKLRAVDRTVADGEMRVKDLAARRTQVSADRESLAASVEAARAKAGQNADRLAEQEERLYTKNEELRALAMQREAAEADIELASDAERLREVLKAYDPNLRSSLRAMFESYSKWREAKKTEGQLTGESGDFERNLKISQSKLELTQLKLAKYDEELALLEKQTGFFNSDTRVERLIADQRSQKKALSERLPLISAQIDAIQHAQLSLKLRQELLSLGTTLHREQFEALQESYYQRLRWPVVALGALFLLYLVCAYAVLPLLLKNEDLLLARRLSRYLSVLLAIGTVGGFLFDDLSMVAATLGVVSAALVISLQDVCTSMFGWFVIMMGGKFGIGDRLEVDGARGDIIDIQLLRTTMLEVNGWLGADQPTGRVIVLPNNFIFKSKVYNFTHGHPYIWGKIELTVTFTTPVAAATSLFTRVLTEETKDEFAGAQQAASAMKKRYGVDDATYQPKIYTTISDSGITFGLFYVSHYRSSSTMRSRINRRLIAELETHPHIQLAYHTMSLLHAQTPTGTPTAVLGSDTTMPPFPATATTPGAPGQESDKTISVINIPGAERV